MIGKVSFNNIHTVCFKGAKRNIAPRLTCAQDSFVRSEPNSTDFNKKWEYIQNSKLLHNYNLESNRESICGERIYNLNNFRQEAINILDHCNLDELKIIEAKCKEIEDKCQEFHISKDRIPYVIKTMADLYFLNSDAYNYAINSKFLTDRFIARGFSAYDCIKCLNVTALKEIEKGDINPISNSFIKNSDLFYLNPDNVEILHSYLSENKIEGDMTVKRAERHTGIFDNIPLSQNMSDKIRTANILNKKKTKQEAFFGYPKMYHDVSPTNHTIYTYISRKKELSLADAMLMMKYLDDNMQKEVLENIKNKKLYDNRFKSASFSETFADEWLEAGLDKQPSIMNTIKLSAGTEGRYLFDKGGEHAIGDNYQHEFLINNNPSETIIEDASYNKERNVFELKSTMKML